MERKKLLLAEDDAMLASLLKYRLEREGYQVTLEENGKAVKESLARVAPDVLIADIMMPYFSGIELADHVRNHIKSDIPIILMSSASNDANIISAFDMGVNDFIAKPISPPELIARVSREIKRHYQT